jgi:hypothetical protein
MLKSRDDKKEPEKYPFYPKPSPVIHDGLKYLAERQLTVEIDEIDSQQVIIVSKNFQ